MIKSEQILNHKSQNQIGIIVVILAGGLGTVKLDIPKDTNMVKVGGLLNYSSYNSSL